MTLQPTFVALALLATAVTIGSCMVEPRRAERHIPTREEFVATMKPCMDHLVEMGVLADIAEVGAVSATRASRAKEIAEVCSAANDKMRKTNIPPACMEALDEVQKLAWAVHAILSGKPEPHLYSKEPDFSSCATLKPGA